MTHILTRRGSLLRTALTLDAAVTGANGVAYLVAAGPLGELFGLSETLLRGTGAFLLAFAFLVAFVATRPQLPRPAVIAVVGANAVWAAGSIASAIVGWGDPATAGTVWIAMQAVVVGGFAELQAMGLRSER